MIYSELERWVNAKVAQHRSGLKASEVSEKDLIVALEKDTMVPARAMRDFCMAAAFSDVANKMNIGLSMFSDDALEFGALYKEIESRCENIETPTREHLLEGWSRLSERERSGLLTKVSHSVRSAAILLKVLKDQT